MEKRKRLNKRRTFEEFSTEAFCSVCLCGCSSAACDPPHWPGGHLAANNASSVGQTRAARNWVTMTEV